MDEKSVRDHVLVTALLTHYPSNKAPVLDAHKTCKRHNAWMTKSWRQTEFIEALLLIDGMRQLMCSTARSTVRNH